ncbi:TnsD family Tn7-like transposition protein [Derxia gummosa]|uniref:TnsD family Tn7-like transposition protein n=1 Tax=Derxia gummosa DSM 723 TaxID=1121388 RepID=A0A8B6XBT1_9BURK|nr:TniQ family protein [Derxia gummosa]
MALLPKPYDDEVVGSVFARAAVQAGLPLKTLLGSIFSGRGSHSFLMTSELHRVASFAGVDADELLSQHTMFPYAVAYMTRDVKAAFRTKALSLQPGQECLGSLTKSVSHGVPYRRFCPDCVRQDLRMYGESYWRRAHLLPGALVCLRHHKPLKTANLPLRGRTSMKDITLPHQAELLPTRLPASAALRMKLTERSVQALVGQVQVDNDWREWYRTRVLALGYQLPPGAVAGAALARELRSYFGQPLLESMGCPLPGTCLDTWPALMTRPGIDTPFATPKHVVLDVFLDEGIRAPDDVTSLYQAPGKKTRDYARLDKATVARIEKRIQQVVDAGERTSIKALLTDAGVWSAFRHDRENFPATRATLDEFRASNQAERQVGGRSYWRQRHPSRYSPPQGIDAATDEAPAAR